MGISRSVARSVMALSALPGSLIVIPGPVFALSAEAGRSQRCDSRQRGNDSKLWARGTFTRPEKHHDNGWPGHGHIWVCKLGWWKGAPWDLRPNLADNRGYSYEPALSQLYDSADVELYRRLGASAIAAAAKYGRFPLVLPNAALAPVKDQDPVSASCDVCSPQEVENAHL